MSSGLGGPGRSGGLLFLGVLAFVAYLAVTASGGVLRLVLVAALVAAGVALGRDVLRRR